MIVGRADAAEEQAGVLVDLCDGRDAAAGIDAGSFLRDGDGWGQAVDEVHVRPFQIFDELAGERGQPLHMAPLAFSENCVMGERAFARAAQAGDRGQPITGNVYVQVA